MLKKILSLAILLIVNISCSRNIDLSSDGKLSIYHTTSKKTFSFTVSDNYIKTHSSSKLDEKYPKITKSDLELLKHFLKTNKYCINKNGELSFLVTTRQEKIYDATFSNLIEQNYNAKPVTPVTYFGECV